MAGKRLALLFVVLILLSGVLGFAHLVTPQSGCTTCVGGVLDISGDVNIAGLDTVLKRIHYGGTGITVSDITVTGFGATPTITPNDNANDSTGLIQVGADAGTAKDATLKITFADGSGGNNVVCLGVRADSVDDSVSWKVIGLSQTAVTFQFRGTPAAGNTYGLVYHCDFH